MKITLFNKLTGDLGPIVNTPESGLQSYVNDTFDYIEGGFSSALFRLNLATGEVEEKATPLEQKVMR